MSNNRDNEAVGWVIGILFIIGLAILIARTLFPVFLILTILCFIILIIILITDFSNDNFRGYDLPASFYVLIVFLILVAGTFITWVIGYGVGGTNIGQASLGIYSTFTDIEKTVSGTIDTTINEIVESNCQILNKKNCDILKQSAEAGRTLREIENLILNLKRAQGLIS